MPRYAADTSVSAERSRAEIERTLVRYGAEQFMYGWDEGRAIIGFRLNNRHIKFVLPLPNRSDREFTHTPERGLERSHEAMMNLYDQAVRQRWRALNLVVKAKLEAVESGITTFDDEFMAHIVLPDGKTVGQFMRPQIINSYATGEPPKMLPHFDD